MEESLNKALSLSKDPQEKIEIYLLLSRYYENISEYKKMKNVLLNCQSIAEDLNVDILLAKSWVMLGHYYFRKFNFIKSKENFIKAKDKILISYQNHNDSRLLRSLSECLHFIGRIHFEECEFVSSVKFYMDAQNALEESVERTGLDKELNATAFYHLRIGQVLGACKLNSSAKFHFLRSQQLFIASGGFGSSSVHIGLALADLIECEVNNSSTTERQNFLI